MTAHYDGVKGGFVGDTSRGLDDFTILKQQDAGVNCFDTPDMAQSKMNHKKTMDNIKGNRYYVGEDHSGPSLFSSIGDGIATIFKLIFVKFPQHHPRKFSVVLFCLIGIFFISSTEKWEREEQYKLLPKDFKFESPEFWGISNKDKLSFFRNMSDAELHKMFVGNKASNQELRVNFWRPSDNFKNTPSQFKKLTANQKLAYMQVLRERITDNTHISNLKGLEQRAFVWNSCGLLEERFYNHDRFSKDFWDENRGIIEREVAALQFNKGCYSIKGPAEAFTSAVYKSSRMPPLKSDALNKKYYDEVKSSKVMLWIDYKYIFSDLFWLVIFVLSVWALFTMPKSIDSDVKA